MPDFGAPVAQNVQVPNFVQTLSGLMGLKQQQQALQSGALGIQQQQQNLQRGGAETQMTQQSAQQRAALAKVDWGKYTDETGTVSTDKMLSDPALHQAAGDQLLDVVKTGAAIRFQQLQNKTALVNLNDGLRNQFGAVVGSLRTDPDVIADNQIGRQKVSQAITQFGQAGGPDAARIASIFSPVAEHAPPGKLANGLSSIQLQAMDASRQAAAQAPTYTDTGAQLTQINPQAAGGNLGVAPNLNKSLGPQAIMGADAIPRVFGGPGGGTPPAGIAMSGGAAPHPGGFPTQAQAQGQSAAAADMATHFSGLNASAQSLPITTALTKTIQGLAPSAFTGVGGDKKQFTTGVLRAFRINATGDAQTDTNLLNKAIAQLNISTPAGTDAARQLVEAGQPNSKMDQQAIKEAAGTIAGQVRMNVYERNLLNNVRYANGGSGDPGTYQQTRQWFESNADPRIWQYEDLVKTNPSAARQFINRQPDKADLVQKTEVLEKAGVFK